MAGGNRTGGGGRPLKSWKEIAAFFGRDERTVKRWESGRGMPVHRLPGTTRASVYAYPAELEEWLKGSRGSAALSETAPDDAEAKPAEDIVSAGIAPAMAVPPRAGISLSPAAPMRRRALLVGLVAAAGMGMAAAAFVALPVGSGEAGGNERLSDDPAARDLYLSANYQMALRTGTGLNRAVQLFTQAIAQDPEFAAAYAGLAKAYSLLSQYAEMPPEQAYPLAKAAGERALKLDPNLASAHAALGLATFYWDRDFAGARRLFETALEIDPGSAETNHWYGLIMMQVGEFDIAVRAIKRAQEIDPGSRAILANKALILYHAGRLDEAADLLRQFTENAEDYPAPHFYLADIYFDQERYREFLDESLEAARIVRNDAMRTTFEAARRGFEAGGRDGMLEALLAEQRARQRTGALPAYKLARTLAFLGREEEALNYLALSVAEREPDSLGIKIDSAFAAMRDSPTYRDLLAKAGHTPLPSGSTIRVAEDRVTTGSAVPR